MVFLAETQPDVSTKDLISWWVVSTVLRTLSEDGSGNKEMIFGHELIARIGTLMNLDVSLISQFTSMLPIQNDSTLMPRPRRRLSNYVPVSELLAYRRGTQSACIASMMLVMSLIRYRSP